MQLQLGDIASWSRAVPWELGRGLHCELLAKGTRSQQAAPGEGWHSVISGVMRVEHVVSALLGFDFRQGSEYEIFTPSLSFLPFSTVPLELPTSVTVHLSPSHRSSACFSETAASLM